VTACKSFRKEPEPELHCIRIDIPLGPNLLVWNDWAKGDRLCTKAAAMKQLLKVSALEAA